MHGEFSLQGPKKLDQGEQGKGGLSKNGITEASLAHSVERRELQKRAS